MIWPSSEAAQYWSAMLTICGSPFVVAAVVVALWQLSLSKRASSVTALVSLHQELRACWRDYLTANDPDGKALAFGDLCNAIEVGCAALTDKMVFGESKRVLESYLLNTLKIIERNDAARNDLVELIHEPQTFSNIHRFLRQRRGQFRALGRLTEAP